MANDPRAVAGGAVCGDGIVSDGDDGDEECDDGQAGSDLCYGASASAPCTRTNSCASSLQAEGWACRDREMGPTRPPIIPRPVRAPMMSSVDSAMLSPRGFFDEEALFDERFQERAKAAPE